MNRNLLEKLKNSDIDFLILSSYLDRKYLARCARKVPDEIFTEYRKALLELGYTFEDHFFGNRGDDNCMLLDSYRDADCSNPEELPDWFKEYPVVLEDRDLVYKYKKK